MMRFIPKNKKAILSLTAGLCLSLCFTAGCKDEAPSETKPVVVKKRIDQAPPTTTAPETNKVPASEKSDAPEMKEAAAPDSETAAPAAEKTVASVSEPAPPEAEKEEVPVSAQAAPEAEKEEVPVSAQAAPEAEIPVETEKVKKAGKTAEGTEQTSLKTSLLDNSIPPYDPTGKIDPFAALFSKESSTGTSNDTEPKRTRTPLERIDISQLQLKAVIQAKSGNRAMVEDGTGKPYILKTGTYVGVNSGIVTKILKDRIVIEEKTKDFLGRVSANTRELKIQKPFGEE